MKRFSFRNMPFLQTTAATGAAYTPVDEGYWTLFYTFDFSNGGADGTQYTTTGVGNTTVTGDYAYVPRVWANAGGVTRKAMRFPKYSEDGGGNNSHYREYIKCDVTYLTGNSMDVEGRIVSDVLWPTTGNLGYRTSGGSDNTNYQITFFTDTAGSRYLYTALDGASTLGVYNGAATGLAPLATQSISGSTTGGIWHTIDFRYKSAVGGGYLYAKWDSVAYIYQTGLTTTTNPTKVLYLSWGGTSNYVNSDLNYFSAVSNIRMYKKA